VFLSLLIVQSARHSMLDDPGLGWHLRNIDAMIAQWGFLHEDPFSYHADGRPREWLTNQWLGEVPFWLGERWAGEEGVAVVATVLLAFLFRCLYRMLLADGLPWPAAAGWTAAAAMGTSCSWAARPNLFTFLFALVTARVCEGYHAGALSRRRTLWLLPLFAVWANVHGGFIAGFTFLGVTLAVEVVIALLATDPESRMVARGRVGHLALLTGGAFLATLVNPYGPYLYRWVFRLLGDPYFMSLHQEWQPPDFHGKGAMRFELLMLLFPPLLGLTRRRANLVELALAVVWLHFALTGFRYVAVWVLVATPLLARSGAAIPWVTERVERLRREAPDSFVLRTGVRSASWLWTGLAVVALLWWARSAEGTFVRHQSGIIPARALDELLAIHARWQGEHGRPLVVFHNYNWGGYLTWHGWPAFRNWIDDRNEVQGEGHVRDYFATAGAEPGWRDKLAGVDLVAMHPEAPLSTRLTEDTDRWKEVFRDDSAVIFERTGPSQR
jgi:hypothetical protein